MIVYGLEAKPITQEELQQLSIRRDSVPRMRFYIRQSGLFLESCYMRQLCKTPLHIKELEALLAPGGVSTWTDRKNVIQLSLVQNALQGIEDIIHKCPVWALDTLKVEVQILHAAKTPFIDNRTVIALGGLFQGGAPHYVIEYDKARQ